jgi:hypothetical protein
LRKKIYHFYHIWADGEWQVPLQDNLDYLHKGDLINNLDEFYVGIVGKEENRLLVKQYLQERNIKHKVCTEKDRGYEQETLDEICNLKDEDAYILYAHTKGSYNTEEYEHRWRKELSKNLIENWRECIEKLQDNQAVGNQYTVVNRTNLIHVAVCYPPGKIFARYGDFDGNFWWSHLRYLKMLGRPYRILDLETGYRREAAETWLRNLCNVFDHAKIGDAALESEDKQPRFSVYSFWVDYGGGAGAKVETFSPYKSFKELINSLLHKKEINKSSIIIVFLYYEDIYKSPIKLTIESYTKISKNDGNRYDRLHFRKGFLFKDPIVLFELTNLW